MVLEARRGLPGGQDLDLLDDDVMQAPMVPQALELAQDQVKGLHRIPAEAGALRAEERGVGIKEEDGVARLVKLGNGSVPIQ